jgi:hypothetical protein
MKFVSLVIGGTLLLAGTVSQSATTAATQAPAAGTQIAQPAGDPVSIHGGLLKRYCIGCHNERNQANAGKLALDSIDLARVGQDAEVWEKVILKLRAGLMPPAGRSRPDAAARTAFVTFLETELDRHAAATPNPGRPEAFHRLNRAEYRNAIRDLFGLDMDMRALLPSDDASYGFDNIAGVLKISQSRLEQYLTVARRVTRTALGTIASPEAHEYRVAGESVQQYDHIEGLPFGTRGGMAVQHYFPRDGEYEFQIDLLCRGSGECDGSVGFADEHRLLVLVDGEQVKEFRLEPRTELRPPKERTWRTRVSLKAGPHAVGVTFAKVPSIREVDSAYQRFQRPFFPNSATGQPHHVTYQPFLEAIRVVGPFGTVTPSQIVKEQRNTPSLTRQRVFTCYPERRSQWDSCARSIIRTLARRAYRRPVTDADVELLMGVYRQDAAGEGGFEGGVEAALQTLLVSPEFLYRVERDPAGLPPRKNYRLTDLELASRLSFFLWSSIPDEELLTLAERGRLKDAGVLDGQIRRMVNDWRADGLVENFAGQWLLLRNLDAVRPDLPLFPNFDDSVRVAARRETELLFGSILRESRPVGELLTADYTFLNERLAGHYGIPGVYGDEFRRVHLPDDHRRGLFGHASILIATSYANRTSPVKRGKWILENVLGTPPPEPPPNVPAFKENDGTNHQRLGVRERLAKHRTEAVCAGCHATIDPPGFALENFDAVGQWRERDEGLAMIDASGALPDGTKFDGLNQFRTALLKDPEVFACTVTRKLMTYALGRGLEPYDMPAVRHVVREARPEGFKLSALVADIVRSVPFQMRRTADSAQ